MPSPASSEPPGAPPHAPGRLVTPGLVDQHCHGHGGVDFATAPPEAVRSALAALAARGVTRVVASVPTMPAADLLAAVRRLTPLVWSGDLAGIHLEGPFLSPRRCGAQSPADVLRPDAAGARDLVRALLAAGSGAAPGAGADSGARGQVPVGRDHGEQDPGEQDPEGDGANAITAMTYAPELDGAAWLESTLLAAGVLPSPGHTDATAAEFAAAVDRLAAAPRDPSLPAPAVTHLFNAMAGFHHRRPGPVPAALAAAAAGRLRLEVIADGRHVDPAVVRDVVRLVPDAVCVVSDASAATGAPPGRYRLGVVEVERSPSSAAPTLAAPATDTAGTVPASAPLTSTTLASGAVGLDEALALMAGWGIPWETAVRTVTTTPARGLPAPRRSSGWVVWDAPGRPADVVLPGRSAGR